MVFGDFAHYDLVQRNCQHFAFDFARVIGALDDLPPGARPRPFSSASTIIYIAHH